MQIRNSFILAALLLVSSSINIDAAIKQQKVSRRRLRYKEPERSLRVKSNRNLQRVDMAEATRLGVESFKVEGTKLCERITTLATALNSGDLEFAKQAYAASRASYEQIEVLAGSFEDTDCNIDCRPAGFDSGDASPDFVGFHRIEGHLFRDSNVEAAATFADQLIKDCSDLNNQLDDISLFSPEGTWAGMVGLATEIAAKKVNTF